jgi:hypothetical protein
MKPIDLRSDTVTQPSPAAGIDRAVDAFAAFFRRAQAAAD